MGGHDNHGHHEVHTPKGIQESDEEIVAKIRSIELIKHNPQAFHKDIFDLGSDVQLLGGASWLASAGTGAFVAYWYYAQRLRVTPATYYVRTFQTFWRLVLGATVGGYLGYLKFGDRQQIHNAWVAERLRRRYPESINLEAKDLWKLKGVRASHPFYRWT